ncbi:cell division protein FtsQ/DivIB [Octadecabacter sp. R77987]|uniref:cell division protein FtsQ/DivIB n=1 Tax=Octadecabacter sp. R77987 TaxID=3093874 RepID=UPI003673528C
MRALKSGLRRDPAPSRWGYRYQRLMLTPLFRRMIKVGLPVGLVVFALGFWVIHEDNRAMIADKYAQTIDSIQQRPEFMVQMMAVDGADDALASDVREVLPVEFPISSFDLDLEEMRQTVEALNAVADATLRVRPGGILQVDIVQRVPVAVWRQSDGLRLIDADGHIVGPLHFRADRADLPLIAGDGAREQLAEGLQLYRAAGPLAPRMRGVMRMGERRWDIVLDRDQRILLPTDDPVSAFERVVALAQARDMLERDVVVVDMRNPDRPTVRLNEQAVAAMRAINMTDGE